jgi:hypothetical protein
MLSVLSDQLGEEGAMHAELLADIGLKGDFEVSLFV